MRCDRQPETALPRLELVRFLVCCANVAVDFSRPKDDGGEVDTDVAHAELLECSHLRAYVHVNTEQGVVVAGSLCVRS